MRVLGPNQIGSMKTEHKNFKPSQHKSRAISIKFEHTFFRVFSELLRNVHFNTRQAQND